MMRYLQTVDNLLDVLEASWVTPTWQVSSDLQLSV